MLTAYSSAAVRMVALEFSDITWLDRTHVRAREKRSQTLKDPVKGLLGCYLLFSDSVGSVSDKPVVIHDRR